jgi:zinc transport system substrate-binding protein
MAKGFRIFLIAFFITLLLITVSCTEAGISTKITVMVSILPQKYFVERIGGEYVEVAVLVQPGEDPHLYTPTPRQVDLLLSSKIYFLIGIEFEEIILAKMRSVLKEAEIVNTVENIKLRTFEQNGDKREKGIEDPHIWLNPLLVIEQAKVVRDTLIQVDPGHRKAYENNFTVFSNELKALDNKIKEIFAGQRGRMFFVFHPAFGYFADAYGLIQVAVEAEGKKASSRGLEQVMEEAKKQKIKMIFSQPQTAEGNVRAVAEVLGCAVVTLDPLAYNYEENLLDMAKKIKSSWE